MYELEQVQSSTKYRLNAYYAAGPILGVYMDDSIYILVDLNFMNSLNLSFLICIMGITVATDLQGCCV